MKSKSASLQAWAVWWCVAGFYLYEYALRVAPAVMHESLMRDFAINAAALGVLGSCYQFAYVSLQIPCGLIVDRLGVRRVVTISALICATGAALFALSTTYGLAALGQLLIGTGSACAFVSTLKAGTDWFPASQFATLSGLTNLMGTLGATFGGVPLAKLVNQYGWRSALLMVAAIGVSIAILTWMVVRDHQAKNVSQVTAGPLLAGLKLLVKERQIWFIGLVGGLTYIPVAAFAGFWAVPFLMQTYGINNALASTASVMIFVGVGIGSPICVFFSEWLQRRVLTIGLTTVATCLIFIIIIFIQDIALPLMFGLLFLAGLFTGGQIICFVCAKESTPIGLSGTTIGFINTLVMLSAAAVSQPLLGRLLDWAWDGQVRADGIPLYSREAFQLALASIPVCSLLSLVLLFFIKETYYNDKCHDRIARYR